MLSNIGKYFIMLQSVFGKFTKWRILKQLIFKDIESLIILGLEARYLVDPEPTHNGVPTSGTGNANRYTTQSQVGPGPSLYRLGRVARC